MISALTVCVYAYVDSNKIDEANQPMAVMATAEVIEEEPFEAQLLNEFYDDNIMNYSLDELTNFPKPTLDFSNITLQKNQFISFVSIDMD